MRIVKSIAAIALILSACSDLIPTADVEPNRIVFQQASLPDGGKLALGKQLSRKNERLVIHYRQDGSQFCVDRGSLHFNPSAKIPENQPWHENALLTKETSSITYEELQEGMNRGVTSYDPTQIQRLRDRHGTLFINLEEFFRSEKPPTDTDKVVGYISVLLFRCDELELLAAGSKVPFQIISYAVKFER
jgi:hypothetical protein